VGQDGEDRQGRDGLTRPEPGSTPFEAELRRDRRFERRLLLKEALVLLAIGLLVAARVLFMR
jgi:hypothetical protein